MMKNLFYLAFAILTFNACGEGGSAMQKKAPQITTISGTINMAPYPNIIISDDKNFFEAQLTNGQFSISPEIDLPAIYTVHYGRERANIFINPGDSVILNAEGQRFGWSLTIQGKLASENAFLLEKVKLDRDRFSMKVKDFMLEEAEFIAAMDYTRKQNQSEFDKAAKEKKFNPEFISLMNKEILYEWATDRINYKQYHQFYNKVEDHQLSENYYDFLKDITFDDGTLMGSPQYKTFITNYTGKTVQEKIDNDKSILLKDNGEALAKFDFIRESFKAEPVVDFLLYSVLKQHIQYEGANGTRELLNIFNATSQNEYFKSDVQNDYSVWAGLEAGQAAPTFKYKDINDQMYDLQNFRGKYVYIDIWATWCGPCKKEIPYLEALQEKYKNSDKIVFTSISIDQDESAWRKMVTEDQLKGVQLFADNAWQSSIVRDYKIAGIPRFLLIGPEGEIISANAPRPSSEKIKAKLEHLLKS